MKMLTSAGGVRVLPGLMITLMLLYCCAMKVHAADAIANDKTTEGVYWMLVDGDGKLQATVKNGELTVQVIAIKPKARNMRDEKNPDAKLRDRRVLGMVIMQGFHWNEKEQHWAGGTIYDPTEGATYDAFIWTDEAGNLKVRGYRLIGWFGRTETFQRISGSQPDQPQPGEPELVYLKVNE